MMRRLGRDFRLLWAGQTISLAGDQVATLAVPSIAILVLHAGGWQVGLLTAIGYIACPLLGPFAGVAADRYRRRRILIACDLVRLVVFATVAAASATGRIDYLSPCPSPPH
ncbi:hypothetical protein [Actinoallomurus sp. NPDC050550]|uniref:hypothetical protein n=1 Tax=Actinoallomurus sp. NPDC050550 TaxID=3154937 RepID=UPI0033E525BB